MRKWASIIILILSAAALLVIISLSEGRSSYKSLVTDEGGFEKIMNTRTPVQWGEPQLYLNGYKLFYASSDETFYYSLIEDNESAMNPRVKSDKKVAFLGDHLNAGDIEKNVATDVLLYDKDSYCRFSLKVTTLPLIMIDTREEISENDGKMKLAVFDNSKEAVKRVTESDGRIRFRGATTLYYPKKGLRLFLTQKSVGDNMRNNDLSLLGLRKDDDYLLYAAYNDQERIRNVFSQNLWEQSLAKDNEDNIDAGMEYKYVETIINGEYYGLYALGTPLDEKQFELSGDSSKGALYKSIYWSTLNGIMMPENDVTGFECKSLPYRNCPEGVVDNSQWELFLDYCYYLENNRSDSEALLKGIDINNATGMYLFFALIQGMDTTNGRESKNYYFSVRKKEDGSLKALYAPWDMDISWGNLWIPDLEQNFTVPYGVKVEDNYLFEHGYLNKIIVNNNTTILSIMFDRYNCLRENKWSDNNIIKLLNEYETEIFDSGAYRRDIERWPDSTKEDPDKKLSDFKEYVLERFGEMDLYIERLKDVKDESIFVRRSSQLKHFKESDVFIMLNNRDEVLEDSDYIEFFEYIGINGYEIPEDCNTILYNHETGETQFLNMQLTEGTETETIIGTLSFAKMKDKNYYSENDFTVIVKKGKKKVPLYDTFIGYEPKIRFFLIRGAGAETMDLTNDYTLDVNWDTFLDEYLLEKGKKQVSQ